MLGMCIHQIRPADLIKLHVPVCFSLQHAALRAHSIQLPTNPDSQILCRSEEDTEDRERWAWLKERRDAEGRAQDDPSFDPTTILIPKGQEPR